MVSLGTLAGPAWGIVEGLLLGAFVGTELAINEGTSYGLVLVMSDGWPLGANVGMTLGTHKRLAQEMLE